MKMNSPQCWPAQCISLSTWHWRECFAFLLKLLDSSAFFCFWISAVLCRRHLKYVITYRADEDCSACLAVIIVNSHNLAETVTRESIKLKVLSLQCKQKIMCFHCSFFGVPAYIYTRTYLCVCVCIYIYIWIYIPVYIRVCIYAHTCIHINIPVCVAIYIHAYRYVYIYV